MKAAGTVLDTGWVLDRARSDERRGYCYYTRELVFESPKTSEQVRDIVGQRGVLKESADGLTWRLTNSIDSSG